MKTLQKDDSIKRVKDQDAESLVSRGWAYVPKSVWKESKQDKKKVSKKKASKKKSVKKKE